MKSPNDDIRSVPRALAYAVAIGDSSRPAISSTKQAFLSLSLITLPTAADEGLTCLKEAAVALPVASFISLTSCHPFKASRRLIYPGLPFKTSKGNSEPSSIYTEAGF